MTVMHLTAGLPNCPSSQDGGPLQTESSGGRTGWGGWCTGRNVFPLLSQVSSEDKGVLAKLEESVRSNYHPSDGNCGYLGDNALGPKSVAIIAKLEKAEASKVATKLG